MLSQAALFRDYLVKGQSRGPGVYAWYIAQRQNDQAPSRGLTQTGLSLTPAG
jgi:hypothetical protein